MGSYLFRRLLNLIPILIGISFLSFVLITLSPSDPAEVAVRVNEVTPTEEVLAETRAKLGLDKPFLTRYVTWLNNSLHGDFGNRYVDDKPVLGEIQKALPATLVLAGAALCLTLVCSLSAGIVCALYEGTFLDRLIRGCVFLGTAMPSFWAGLLLMWLFAVKLDLVPTSGMDGPSSVLLPAATLSLASIATYTRLIRANMIQNQQENYILYARMRGLSERAITRHMLKNSLQASLTALGMSLPKLIAGTFVVESIFAWPGIGRLCVTAIFNRDLPVIQAYVLIMAVLFVVSNLLVDILSAAVDPRLRKEF